MPRARLAQPFPSKWLKVFLLACALTSLLPPNAAAAQSGRKVKPKPPTSEPVRPDKPAPRITSLVVCGHDISEGRKEYYSKNVSTTVKAITEALNERRGLLLGVLNGGKQTRKEAVARALSEQGAYVLWFGYSIRPLGLSDETVEHIDYVVYKPWSAEILTEGRVYPSEQKEFADPRGIMRLPRVRSRPIPSLQLEAGGREIADRVRNKL
ncbi:MAG TPA: hypothetical protein VF297_23330 [Pyrinomonadaceae bacterium]